MKGQATAHDPCVLPLCNRPKVYLFITDNSPGCVNANCCREHLLGCSVPMNLCRLPILRCRLAMSCAFLGECPAHKALHIQRHDATGRCILKHMRKGSHGGFFMLADVGSPEKVASYGIILKRIPQWMMPVATAGMPSRFDEKVMME
jgi:hypothetical protein